MRLFIWIVLFIWNAYFLVDGKVNMLDMLSLFCAILSAVRIIQLVPWSNTPKN